MTSFAEKKKLFSLLKKTGLKAGLIWILMCFVPLAANSSQLSKTEISDLFHQGKELFRQADGLATTNPEKARSLYLQAAMRYERIISKGGIYNGKLYYNIGNTYFRIKDVGRAILNYRRALQYIPNDPKIRQNLTYARNKRLDKIDEPQNTEVFKTLFFWHYDLSTSVKILLFGIFFAFIWLLAGGRRFVRKSALGWALFLSVVLTMMVGGSLVAEAVSLHRVKPGVIIDTSVITRKGNSETYAPSFTEPLHSGTEFNLLEKRGTWFYIKLPDGRTCWVPEKSVELVSRQL